MRRSTAVQSVPVPTVSVVVPLYDEEGNVAPLLSELTATLGDDPSWEVICVDDGSSDGTLTVLQAMASRDDVPLRVLEHSMRRGQSAAVVTGVAAARGQWVATMDGDMQNVPSDIPRLLDELQRQRRGDPGVVCVAGVRGRRQDIWLRRWSSRVAAAARRAVLGDAFPDTGCGLKVFERDAFMRLPHFDHVHRFLPVLFEASGGRVVAMEVTHRPRLRGESKYGVLDRFGVGVVDLLGVRWLCSRALRRS